jgi:hypothetical protein
MPELTELDKATALMTEPRVASGTGSDSDDTIPELEAPRDPSGALQGSSAAGLPIDMVSPPDSVQLRHVHSTEILTCLIEAAKGTEITLRTLQGWALSCIDDQQSLPLFLEIGVANPKILLTCVSTPH